MGLTALHPPLGVAATKAYALYGHGMAGLALFNIYRKWKSGEESAPKAAGQVAKVIGGQVTGSASSGLGSTMVDGLKQTGVIDQISKETNVNPVVTSDMLKGTVSASAEQGFEDVEGYTVKKATGA